MAHFLPTDERVGCLISKRKWKGWRRIATESMTKRDISSRGKKRNSFCCAFLSCLVRDLLLASLALSDTSGSCDDDDYDRERPPARRLLYTAQDYRIVTLWFYCPHCGASVQYLSLLPYVDFLLSFPVLVPFHFGSACVGQLQLYQLKWMTALALLDLFSTRSFSFSLFVTLTFFLVPSLSLPNVVLFLPHTIYIYSIFFI